MQTKDLRKVLNVIRDENLKITYWNSDITFAGESVGIQMPCHDPQSYQTCNKCGREGDFTFHCCGDKVSVPKERTFWQLTQVSRQDILDALDCLDVSHCQLTMRPAPSEENTIPLFSNGNWMPAGFSLVISGGEAWILIGCTGPVHRQDPDKKKKEEEVPIQEERYNDVPLTYEQVKPSQEETDLSQEIGIHPDVWDEWMSVAKMAVRDETARIMLSLNEHTSVCELSTITKVVAGKVITHANRGIEQSWKKSIDTQFFFEVSRFKEEFQVIEVNLLLEPDAFGVYMGTSIRYEDNVQFFRATSAWPVEDEFSFGATMAPLLRLFSTGRRVSPHEILHAIEGTDARYVTLFFDENGLNIETGDGLPTLCPAPGEDTGHINVSPVVLRDVLQELTNNETIGVTLPEHPQKQVMQIETSLMQFYLPGVYTVSPTLTKIKRKGAVLAEEVFVPTTASAIALVATETVAPILSVDEILALDGTDEFQFTRLLATVLTLLGHEVVNDPDKIRAQFITLITTYQQWQIKKEMLKYVAEALNRVFYHHDLFKEMLISAGKEEVFHAFCAGAAMKAISLHTHIEKAFHAGRQVGYEQGKAEVIRDSEALEAGQAIGYIDGRLEAFEAGIKFGEMKGYKKAYDEQQAYEESQEDFELKLDQSPRRELARSSFVIPTLGVEVLQSLHEQGDESVIFQVELRRMAAV